MPKTLLSVFQYLVHCLISFQFLCVCFLFFSKLLHILFNLFQICLKFVSHLPQICLEIRFKFQKQLFAGVLQNDVFWKFCKIEKNTTAPESLFSKVTGLQSATLFEKRLYHRCFRLSYAKYILRFKFQM